jgi:hypothetical protein
MRGDLMVVRTHHAKGDNTLIGVIYGQGSARKPSMIEIRREKHKAAWIFPPGSLLRVE